MVQDRENTTKQLTQEDKTYHHEYFQRSICRLWLVKEGGKKRDQGGITLLPEQVLTREIEGEKNPQKNLFPLIYKGE